MTVLLPFLDIVFGTIGVFVVVFALQYARETDRGAPPGIDCVVLCLKGDRLTTHWPDGEIGPTAAPGRGTELLQALAATGRPFRSVVFAVGPGCVEARTRFMAAFEEYLDISAGSQTADDADRMAPMLELYPLGSGAAGAALLKEWRGETTP